MQADSTTESWDFDNFVTWLYTNRVRVAIAAVVIVAVIGGLAIYNWKKEQTQADANAALFKLPTLVGTSEKTAQVRAEDYQKVANEYPGTPAGERAELIAAGILFTDGKYPEAQQQFSKFLSAHEGSELQSEAALGVAASLEAQGKINDAVSKYQELIAKYSGDNVISPAKLTLARLLESQNKPAEALKLYDDLARSRNPYDPWAAEAGERREQLLEKNPALKAKPADAVSPAFSNSLITPKPTAPATTNSGKK